MKKIKLFFAVSIAISATVTFGAWAWENDASQKIAATRVKKLKPPTTAIDSGATAKEENWKDSRWNQMNTGQFLGSILTTPNGIIAKGLSIRLSENDETAVQFVIWARNFKLAAGTF